MLFPLLKAGIEIRSICEICFNSWLSWVILKGGIKLQNTFFQSSVNFIHVKGKHTIAHLNQGFESGEQHLCCEILMWNHQKIKNQCFCFHVTLPQCLNWCVFFLVLFKGKTFEVIWCALPMNTCLLIKITWDLKWNISI